MFRGQKWNIMECYTVVNIIKKCDQCKKVMTSSYVKYKYKDKRYKTLLVNEILFLRDI